MLTPLENVRLHVLDRIARETSVKGLGYCNTQDVYLKIQQIMTSIHEMIRN